MKKVIALMLSLCLLTFSGCIRTEKSETKLRLLTSFYPIYIMGLNIVDGVDGVEIDCMASEQTGCLHDFQLKTDDMMKIEKSDGFIINGAGMEGFISEVAERSSNVNIIDSSTGIELLPTSEHSHEHDEDEHDENEDEHEHEHEHEGHHHGDCNSHIWVSVDNYIKQVDNIANGIIELDPQHADEYRKNADIYINKLTKLKSKMETELKDISDNRIITFHEAFDYFAEEFGLSIESVIEREPGSEPNAKELAEIITLVNETDIKALFVEPQYPKSSADIIANETNAKVYTLDPGVSGEMNKDAYINMMEKNLTVLKEALK